MLPIAPARRAAAHCSTAPGRCVASVEPRPAFERMGSLSPRACRTSHPAKRGGCPGTGGANSRRPARRRRFLGQGRKDLPERMLATNAASGTRGCRVSLSTGEAEPSATPIHAGPSRVPGPPSGGRCVPQGDPARANERSCPVCEGKSDGKEIQEGQKTGSSQRL
jgi:hypothetical protein